MNNMNLLKDMELFVRVVHCNGLAAAGRELGMTPSSVTMRINKLEQHYQVKLLSRTTRSINLTNTGREFYEDCVSTLYDIEQVENRLRTLQDEISGPIRITAPSDLGRQHIAPLLDEFVRDNPKVQPFLNLSDSVTKLTENNIDIAIRYGVASDSLLIGHKIADGRRVLCASPSYLEQQGTPEVYSDLEHHRCLTMVQIRTPKSKWFFQTPKGEKSLLIDPARSCDDGAQIREWAIEGGGIALKSVWDVVDDLQAGRLVSVLDECKPDYQSKRGSVGADLYVAFQDRKYIPERTRLFIDKLKQHFKAYLSDAKSKIH